MAGTHGARARQRLGELEAVQNRIQTIHGLVERYAAERADVEPHLVGLRRAFNRLKLDLSGMGLDAMAQVCGGMELVARRGGSQIFKARILREGVGSLRMQLDVEQRVARSELMPRTREEPDEPEEEPQR